MNVVANDTDTEVVVMVSGEIDLASAPSLSGAISAVIDQMRSDLVIDLTDVTFLDAAGLSVLVSARRQLAHQFRMVLRKPRTHVRKVLVITDMESLFAIED